MSAVLVPAAPKPPPMPTTAIAPRERASQFSRLIFEIEDAIEESEAQVEEIGKRGVLRNLFSSSRDDLVAHAEGQNKLNGLLLKLQREAISLNTLGYAYLTSLIAEFERQVNEGLRGSDGEIHVLSSTGKEIAQMATEMFGAILDTSESTQARIDANTEALAEHEQRLTVLAQGVAEQAGLVAAFERFRSGAAEANEVIAQQHASLLSGFRVHEREFAALQSQVAAMRDELSRGCEREASLEQHLRRFRWTVWPALGATAGLCLAMSVHAFGWF